MTNDDRDRVPTKTVDEFAGRYDDCAREYDDRYDPTEDANDSQNSTYVRLVRLVAHYADPNLPIVPYQKLLWSAPYRVVMESLSEDPVMADLIETHGKLTIEPADDMFRRMAASIINQQLSTASARAIRTRVFDHVEVTPEGMLAADPTELHELGLSESKVEYLKNVADAHQTRGYSVAYFEGMTDEEVIAELTEIKGVGTWTAKMALIFCLGREDVFPVEDLGIHRGMETAYGLTQRDAMIEKAAEWAPYRSYASRYLWRVVD